MYLTVGVTQLVQLNLSCSSTHSSIDTLQWSIYYPCLSLPFCIGYLDQLSCLCFRLSDQNATGECCGPHYSQHRQTTQGWQVSSNWLNEWYYIPHVSELPGDGVAESVEGCWGSLSCCGQCLWCLLVTDKHIREGAVNTYHYYFTHKPIKCFYHEATNAKLQTPLSSV